MVVAEKIIIDPSTAEKRLNNKLQSLCPYLDQYLDCDGCPRLYSCVSTHSKLLTLIDEKPVTKLKMRRLENEVEQFIRQSSFPLKS